ncbi:MAG: AbrB/MazE/SpoVT family DNA-binding domain-containing protein, partial [Youngiibacter sp.]|nr:AbrB/MazE/SpoVT family DNA-binding domain-containing protein [Youngiibacter sp.]
CIKSNGMLILIPVKSDESYFAEEILKDLISKGYSGDKLLAEFKKISRKLRPAVKRLIEEADKIAETASEYYTDPTSDIFGD